MRGTNFILGGPGVSRWRAFKAHVLWHLAYFTLLKLLLQVLLGFEPTGCGPPAETRIAAPLTDAEAAGLKRTGLLREAMRWGYLPRLAGAAEAFAPATSKALLETMWGVAESWKYEHEKCYLVLLTGTPGAEVTIKKVKEKECTVTGYTRFHITNGAGKKLTFGEVGSGEYRSYVENAEEWEIQSGLSGTNQEITYWAVVSGASGEEGKVIAWGSCTGTSIGGTGTPVKVAAGKLKVELG